MVHVGVDLHKRSSQIAVLSADGEVAQHRVDNEVARVRKFFEQLPPASPVAIEASGTWWWLVDLLEELGHHPVLSNPKQTKAIAAARLKNDRLDAHRLGVLLRGDLLPTVWIPVRFRLGRSKLSTRPKAISTQQEDDRDRTGGISSVAGRWPGSGDQIGIQADQLRYEGSAERFIRAGTRRAGCTVAG